MSEEKQVWYLLWMNKQRNKDKNGRLVIKESTRRTTKKEGNDDFNRADEGGYPCALYTNTMRSAETTDGRIVWFSSNSDRVLLKQNSRYKTLIFRQHVSRLEGKIERTERELEGYKKDLAALWEARRHDTS